jgi:hypothetical protein
VIVDDIEGEGQHEVRLHWLAADLPFEMTESRDQVVFKSEQTRIRWGIFSSAPGSAAIVRTGKQISGSVLREAAGADTQLLGWEAPTYGDLRPAVSLVQQTRSQLPVRFVTVVLTDERCRFESQNGEIVIRANESEYRVNLSAARPSSESGRFPVSELKA